MIQLRQAVHSLLGRPAPVATTPAPTGYSPPEPRAPFPDAGSAARVVLYVESWCSDSRKAERLCIDRGWATHREDLQGRHAEKLELFVTHHWRTLPVVFIDGRFIGGLKELKALTTLP